MLDQRKSFAWSVHEEERAELRTAGFRIAQGERSLGAHMQFTYKHTNSTQKARFAALKDMWVLLRQSSAVYRDKVTAVRVAAWPRAMYGISIVSMPADAFQTLRSGAMRGLRADLSGAHPGVHLSLVEQPMLDPGFQALWWSVMDFRKFANMASAQEQLVDPEHPPVGGPLAALVELAKWGQSQCLCMTSSCPHHVQ